LSEQLNILPHYPRAILRLQTSAYLRRQRQHIKLKIYHSWCLLCKNFVADQQERTSKRGEFLIRET